jgi:short-subunit dehydrogenase
MSSVLKALQQNAGKKARQSPLPAIDVRDAVAMAEWVARQDAESPLTLAIANAGISAGTGGVVPSDSLEEATRVFDVNLGGVLNTINPALPPMIARKSGQIAIISSVASFFSLPGAPAYAASKAAVRFYGEALAIKLAPLGVGVSVVCPGYIESRMTAVNTFPMPLLMKADKAARLIAEGIAQRKPVFVFPAPMAALVALAKFLPASLLRRILAHTPEKTSLQKQG